VSAALPRLPLLSVMTGAAAIGFAPVLVKLADTGPSMTACWRVLLALPFLWGWFWFEQRGATPPRAPRGRADFLGLGLAGLLFVLDLAVWHWSLRLTTAANSTLLGNLAPVLVAAFAWRFLGEKLTRGFLAGMVLSLLGAALLVGRSLDLDRHLLRGDLLAVTTALFYAAYLLSVKILRRRFSSATILAWSGLVSAPGFALVAWASGEPLLPQAPAGWWTLASLALVCHVGGQCLIGYGMGHLPASLSALSLLIQPVVATLLAWGMLGEAVGPGQWAGGTAILLGIAVAGGLVPWRRPAGA
jgi:drug/metabolite transporter (DMT)-like permease